jgi:putative aldouronate transport system permease protein
MKTDTVEAPVQLQKPTLLQNYRRHLPLFLLFIPGLAYYVIFHYIPIYGLQIAFKNYLVMRGVWGSPWVGFQNFADVFALGSFWEVLRNTIVISAYKIVFGFPAPIILAILLTELISTKFKKVAQTISYLPHFVSWVVLGGLFRQFLSPSMGPVNELIKAVGGDPIYFLADTDYFRGVLVVTSIWKEVGWGSIIYLAALAGIDPQLYEAATIDGANRFQRIRYVTLPSLAPVITIMLLFNLRGIIVDDFDQIFNLYNEAVYSVGDVISTYIYRVGLIDLRYSFSTAVGMFKNVVAFVIIVVANSITKRINEYGIW